ncbi:hypothetical protein V5799_021337 [Amblyomma americanum]|uniref:Uncharacterized protein n=1 Tax=Amblyomma americanum TaxID=6943 RepID=A0AAQ4FQ12_AMBAM
MADKFQLLVKNARQIVQVVDNGQRIVKGAAMKNVAILQGNEISFSIVVNQARRLAHPPRMGGGPRSRVRDEARSCMQHLRLSPVCTAMSRE